MGRLAQLNFTIICFQIKSSETNIKVKSYLASGKFQRSTNFYVFLVSENSVGKKPSLLTAIWNKLDSIDKHPLVFIPESDLVQSKHLPLGLSQKEEEEEAQPASTR